MKIKKSFGEKVFDCANVIFLALIAFVTLYPCYYVLVASVSDPIKLYDGVGLLFWPKDFALYSYMILDKSLNLFEHQISHL